MRTLFTLLVVAACGSDPSEPSTSSDATSSETGTGADSADTGSLPTSTCLARWEDGVTAIDPDGPDTQIHATSAFGHDGLWVAWNRPDDGSSFDVWLARLDCAGDVVVGPVEVGQTDDSELDPVLAVRDDRVLVAWSADTRQAPDNLDIRYRVFDVDGLPLADAVDLAASRGGSVVTGNATLPAVVATDDGFLLAGSWGHDESPAFQSFVVALDRDGGVLWGAEDGELDAVYGQTYVALAFGAEIWLAWQEDSVSSTAPTLVGGPLGQPAELASPGARPALAVGPDGVWAAWDDDEGSVTVRTPAGDDVVLGEGFVHSVSVVAREDGGAVVLAMELVSGVSNRLVLWGLDADGAVVHDQVLSTDEAISVYRSELTRYDDQHVAVAFQDGVNPAFRARVEWVTLPW